MPVNESSCNNKNGTSKNTVLNMDEKLQVDALRTAVLNENLISPPEHIWERITITQASLDSVTRSKISWQKSIIKLAASVFFVSISWLMWNNHALKAEMNEVLQVNRLLEKQLMESSMPTFRQTQLLFEVRQIEIALSEAETTKEKLILLKEREKLMQAMIFKKQGHRYEYSI